MNIWAELLTSFIRALMQWLVGILLAHGIIDAAQAGHFTTELTASIVGGIILFIGTYGWSVWRVLRNKVHFLDALAADPSTPPHEVIAQSKGLPVTETIAKATAPGNTPTP